MSAALRRLATVLALLTSVSTMAGAQETARSLLERVSRTSAQARTLTAHVVVSRRGPAGQTVTASGTARLLKPNFARIQLTGDDSDVSQLTVSDGRDLYKFADPTHYTQSTVDLRGSSLRDPWWALPLSFFFVQSLNPFGPLPDPTATYTLLPDEVHAGQPVHVIALEGHQAMAYSARILIDHADRIVATEVDFGSGPGAAFFKADLTELTTGTAATPASFRFTPPAHAVRKQGSLTDLMLPLGETAPDFRLPGADGQPVTLAAAHPGAKATLVNFWFLNCPPCRLEFPDFERLYTDLHAKGLNIIAVDKGDDPAAVTRYARTAGLTFSIALGGEPDLKSVFARYRVTDLYPASYLLDADGRIVYRAGGGDLDGLKKALAGLGVQ